MSKENKKEKKEVVQSQDQQAENRIKELEAEVHKLREESFNGNDSIDLLQRISFLEGKLKGEKSQEELYQERVQKYEDNIRKKREKEAKKKQLLDELDSED